MSVVWLDKDKLFPVVIEKLENVAVVLDIGCGIMPQRYVRPLVHICCEPFEQYVEFLQIKTKDEFDRTYVIFKGGWADAVRLFPPKSVDTVFLVDVIEHLEKEEALELLRATETLARRQIALFTPLGFMPQHHPGGKDAWGLDGGEWQEHKSGWQPEDFDDSWEIFASCDFHSTDNKGKKFDEPFGAIWAIKNYNQIINPEFKNNKKNIFNLIQIIVSYAQYKDIIVLSNIIQKLIKYSSTIDMKIYSVVLNVYISIKYSKLLVFIVDKYSKCTTKNE